jgi:capsular polysaccharide transport system permease protein
MTDSATPLALQPPLPANAAKQQRGGLRVVRRYPLLLVSALLVLLACVYWGLLASDRYVSEAHLVVDRAEAPSVQANDLASVFMGSRSNNDLLVLRDHLRSVDMLQKLDGKLKLRAHYSDKRRDLLSRMWFADASQEFFHDHYLSRTSIELDELAGVLRIRAQSYDAAMAQAVARTLIEEGELFLNELAHRLAREQVAFLEQQVAKSAERAMQTRRGLLAYQNTTGMISPQAKAESLSAITAKLEAQISELKARRSAMQGYLSPDAPDVAQLSLQIGALERQLKLEQDRLASPKGSTLNRNVEEFQRLELEAGFAQDVYKTSLVALENGRVEAIRKLKKVSVLQSPTLAEYPLEPRRIYNIFIFALAVLALAGIAHLLAAIVRDHQD